MRRYDAVIDVHWINLAFAIAYHNFKRTNENINSIGVNNTRTNDLVKLSNEKFDAVKWNELTRQQAFHKLNWRLNYRDEIDGEKTFYGHMVENTK